MHRLHRDSRDETTAHGPRSIRHLLLSAVLMGLSFISAAPAEPPHGAANEHGRWRHAAPGTYFAVNEPRFKPVTAGDLADDERVIGVLLGGEARAYPLRLMTYHHVANDVVAGQPIAVTYCGMANSAMSYERPSAEAMLEAGGMYGGTLAMREEGTERCWPQMAVVALPEDPVVAPPLKIAAPSIVTTWKAWKAAHPETLLLQPEERFDVYYIAYDRSAKRFAADIRSSETVVHFDERLPFGTEVYGLAHGGKAVAYPLEHIKEHGAVEAEFGGQKVTIHWDKTLETPMVDSEFEGIALRCYWYAWAQFHPETTLP